MATTVSNGSFQTTDLALATFLSMHGQSFYFARDGESDRALFVFNPIDNDESESVKELVGKFHVGLARVEPSKFMREVGSVRGQLYDFLDGKRDR